MERAEMVFHPTFPTPLFIENVPHMTTFFSSKGFNNLWMEWGSVKAELLTSMRQA